MLGARYSSLTDLFQDVNVYTSTNKEERTKMLMSLVLRQGQPEERMANDLAQREGQSSASSGQQDGVRTRVNLPSPAVVRVGEASRGEEFVESVKY